HARFSRDWSSDVCSSDLGFAVLDHILDESGNTNVIIITGRGEKEHALRAVGKGAYDFFYKPIELDELKVVLKRAFHVSQLEQEQRDLRQRLSGDTFEGMIGTSSKMQDVFSAIRKVATTDARSEEHTSELQSRENLVCRLLL